ncbi:phosphatase PAP2 family protein [Arachidicoccus soli]|uniref:Phosphatase PAP2 family protein n=1 Tax=Arachidicoccus soli TaxID=2341117 RepID=A0A386HNG7_9BACT|nr:phosphatase PAP2 family protein [Arachidicoccus soli]AYD47011.1 phosphatase PAP2 family protein [Arachidicoccus soli]
MLETLNKWDTWLFLKINTQWHNSFFDAVIPWWRDQNTWLPLYLFLLLFVFINFGWKAWSWLLFVIITVTLSDQLSSHFMKYYFHRPRPCQNETLKYQVRLLLNYCPGNPSFTSSHAANHFSVGMFFFYTLKPYFKKWSWLFVFWAATISYGQVYVGIHYPGDILGGTVIGIGIGTLTYFLFNKYFGMPPLLKAPLKENLTEHKNDFGN